MSLQQHCHEWLGLEDIFGVAKTLAGIGASQGDMFTAPLERLQAIAGIHTRGRVQEALKALETEGWIRIHHADQRKGRGQSNVYTLVRPEYI